MATSKATVSPAGGPPLATAGASQPAGLMLIGPDPAVTASVYNAHRLDDLLLRGIAPFWQQVKSGELGHLCRIWFVRYRRGGDHLKVRIHAPEEMVPELRRQLQEAVDRYFAGLPPHTAEEALEKRGRAELPPLDREDRTSDEYPDRSLLWTSYERSHVSLGGSPLLQDDVYVGHLTRFLSDAGEQLLKDLKLDESGSVPHQKRQTLLMKMIIGSLATLDFSEEQRTGYLLHHRNWLLRFALIKALDRAEKASELLGRYQRQIEKMGAGIGPIERTMQRIWDAPAGEGPAGPLRLLADHLETFRGIQAYQLDPFSEEPAFTGIFKALHSVANQLGLPMHEEAFTYHLLLHVRAPRKAAAGLQLMPD